MTDEEFLQRFEAAELADFRHADHVRAAWAYVDRDGPDRALTSMLEGIQRFANAKGADVEVPLHPDASLGCADCRRTRAVSRRPHGDRP